MLNIYCDGGVILKNPSTYGGTWAYVFVENGQIIKQESGFVPCPDGKVITNNLTEQIAIIKALEFLGAGTHAVIYSDSQTALGRTFDNWRRKNLPKNVCDRLDAVIIKHKGFITGTLVKGHATKKEISEGISKKGLPTSKYNTIVDELCGEEAKKYLLNLKKIEEK